MTSFMLYGLGDAHERPDLFPVEPADISRYTLHGDKRPEPPASVSLSMSDGGSTLPPAPVPVGLRVAVQATIYVAVLLVILCAIGALVGVAVRIWSWAVGL